MRCVCAQDDHTKRCGQVCRGKLSRRRMRRLSVHDGSHRHRRIGESHHVSGSEIHPVPILQDDGEESKAHHQYAEAQVQIRGGRQR